MEARLAPFLGIDASQFDQKLIVRSAQVHALMPMMQFSVAPWRILNPQHLQAVKAMAQLHRHLRTLHFAMRAQVGSHWRTHCSKS